MLAAQPENLGVQERMIFQLISMGKKIVRTTTCSHNSQGRGID